MTPAPTRAGTSPLAETISVLHAARVPPSEFGSTIDLHIAILQAREQIAAALPCTGSDARVSDGSRPAFVLSVRDVVADWNAFALLFRKICLIAARHHPEQAAPFEEFARSDLPRLQEWADAYLHNELDARLTLQPVLLGFVLNNTLHPFLAASPAWAEWKTRVDKDTCHQGSCPVCGGEPDFAALEKESGARRLLCSRCDAEWTFHRAMCPFCGAADPANWGYYADGKGAYRLYVCSRCRRYLKTIDLRELVRPVNLAAERILTIPMDMAALNAGYLASSSADLSPVS